MKQSLRTTVSRICAIVCVLCLLLGVIPMMLADEPDPSLTEGAIIKELEQNELEGEDILEEKVKLGDEAGDEAEKEPKDDEAEIEDGAEAEFKAAAEMESEAENELDIAQVVITAFAFEADATPLPAPENLTLNGYTVTWSPIPGVTKYLVSLSTKLPVVGSEFMYSCGTINSTQVDLETYIENFKEALKRNNLNFDPEEMKCIIRADPGLQDNLVSDGILGGGMDNSASITISLSNIEPEPTPEPMLTPKPSPKPSPTLTPIPTPTQQPEPSSEPDEDSELESAPADDSPADTGITYNIVYNVGVGGTAQANTMQAIIVQDEKVLAVTAFAADGESGAKYEPRFLNVTPEILTDIAADGFASISFELGDATVKVPLASLSEYERKYGKTTFVFKIELKKGAFVVNVYKVSSKKLTSIYTKLKGIVLTNAKREK